MRRLVRVPCCCLRPSYPCFLLTVLVLFGLPLLTLLHLRAGERPAADGSQQQQQQHAMPLKLFAQLVDLLGLPSTVYMPDVTCRGCNDFDAPFLPETSGSVDDDDGSVVRRRGQQFCSFDRPVFLLIVVVSRAENLERRDAVRKTWGSVAAYGGRTVKTVFICARSDNETTRRLVGEEERRWRDVIQINMTENYAWLTNKTVLALKWAAGRCGDHFSFLLKTDDDSFNVPQRFVDYLDRRQSDPDRPLVAGVCSSGEIPHRVPDHRWYVPLSEYPGVVLPIHCKGRAYVLSRHSVLSLLAVSDDVTFNSMEDVFVTGVCRAVARHPITCMSAEIPSFNEGITDFDLASGVAFNVHHVHSSALMTRLWSLVNNGTSSSSSSSSSCRRPNGYRLALQL